MALLHFCYIFGRSCHNREFSIRNGLGLTIQGIRDRFDGLIRIGSLAFRSGLVVTVETDF